RGRVVAGDQAAQRDAGMNVEEWQDGVEDRAADILEIDVDAAGNGFPELLREVRVVAVDAGVEAECLDHEAAFLRAAGNADDAAALYFGDLADDRADRAAGGSDHDRFTFLRLADPEQAVPCGEARHAENAQRMRRP